MIKGYFTIMARINILATNEVIAFETPPVLSKAEKEYSFTLSENLYRQIISLENDNGFLMITLMFGYFKATNKFFDYKLFHQDDIDFVSSKYNIEFDNFDKLPNSRTIRRYKSIIKKYFGIIEYTINIQNQLKDEANILAKNFVHRKKIFYTLAKFSINLKIEIPSYTELTKIIKVALYSQQKDIVERLELFMDDDRLKELDEFLEKDKNYKNKYYLMHYKRLEHSTAKNQMLLSLGKFKVIKSKFNILKEIIETIGIDPKIAKYHSRWIEKSQIFQLKRKKNIESNFLLLCFISDQYFIRNDNLIDRFIATVQSAKNASYRAQKEYSFEIEPHKNRVIESLEKTNISTLNEIELIINNSSLSAIKKVEAIEIIVSKKAECLKEIISEKSKFDASVKNKYDFIQKKSVSLQGKLSGILKSIELDEKTSNKNIIEAINFFKNNSILTMKAPSKFLNEEEVKSVFENGKFQVSLYKALLFFYVSDAFKNGSLNLKYSYRFRNFDDYLIDKEKWDKDKNMLLKVHKLEHLQDYDNFFKTVKVKLEESYKTTNQNIKNGLNPYFTDKEESFILKTPKVEKEEKEESITKYFPNNEYLSIINVLYSIDKYTNFLSSFQHYSHSKIKSKDSLLLASILGYGCNLSLSKIGKISKGINENQLENTKIWYFSEENTIEANDKIIAFMEELEIVKLFRHNQNFNHTSSDGQKYNISSSIDSTNAGYSFKYFGMDKGVVAYTFIDESHRLFHSQVINVNERESGYVIDGLLNNEVINANHLIHSVDTFGFNEVVFGLTNLLGFSFAPRIKNFKEQQLYSLNSPKIYHNLKYKIVPNRKVREQVIKDNWDAILRFIITIKERKTTATQLLKRLTSYSKHHTLYTALKEIGRIIKTDFLLIYIDDVTFRQRIEKSLNKGEASNKFSKAVFFGNNNEFTVSTIEEQNIANNSKRLIQNSIILWNYLYLTKKIQQAKNQNEKDEIIKALKNSSIVHWSHINFYGEYDFTSSSKRISNLINIDKEKGLS